VIAGLRRFVEELRKAGLRASPGEWIEALRAVELVGLADRERFRQVLRATLVKRSTQLATFDQVFERFFVAPPRGRRKGREAPSGAGDRRVAPRRSVPGEPSSAPRPQPVPLAPQAPRTRRHTAPPQPFADQLDALRQGSANRQGRLRRVVVPAPAGEVGSRRPEAPCDPLERDLRERISAADERELVRELRRVIERIRLGSARRARRCASGRPDLRRVFRDSLRSGGVPFVLPRRRRRQDTPRVALLVDVSWSTIRAAGLFLQLATEFLVMGRQTRVFLFVDRAVEATDEIARCPARPLAELLGRLEGLNLSAPSDYGRVFHQLLRSPRRPRGHATVLVILGDGRTNRFAALDWALGEIAQQCGAVLWLVPEPYAEWGSHDSALPQYLAHVDTAVEVRDLNGLARGVSELLRAL
jgi:uncharacterized protein with von Willebrand factor type A (vWA) domain